MTEPARLAPVDPNADDSADANRERAEQYIRRKLATVSGPKKRLFEQALRELQERAAA